MTGKQICLAAALSLSSALTPAFAQNAAEATLNEYFGIVEGIGATVAVAEKTSTEDSATWRDVVVSFEGEPDGEPVRFEWAVPSITARMRGEGIGLEMAERSILRFDGPEDEINFGIEMIATGQDYLVNRDGDMSRTTFSIDKIEMITLPGSLMDLSGSITGTSGFYLTNRGEIANFSGTQSIDAMSYNVNFSDPEEEGSFTQNSNIENLELSFAYDELDPEALQDFVTGARNFAVDYRYGKTASTMEFEADGQAGSIATSAGAASGTFSAQNGTMSVKGEGSDISYDVNMPGATMMPPFAFNADTMQVAMDGKVSLTREETPANILVNFGGLRVTDNLWNIVDPTQQIPRDPMDLTLDLGAMLKWKIDSLDEMEDGGPPPFDATSVDLRDLTLRAAGAQLLGTGSADINMMGPVPMPVGKLELDLKGGMGLLDTLEKMGLVPPQQAMMARMFSQSMARPGPDGGDHLVTEVEAKADGAILVNGTRMR